VDTGQGQLRPGTEQGGLVTVAAGVSTERRPAWRTAMEWRPAARLRAAGWLRSAVRLRRADDSGPDGGGDA
jgi:hypothetical protein